MTALTPIELATGIVLGSVPEPAHALPEPLPDETPLNALERACVPALERGACFVSFSGGNDSSLVLAAAANAARRHGLPLPVPVTHRFPGVIHAEESAWQELVITHLGLTDWIRLELTGELDVLGDVATRGLRRHGLLWPFNAHFHAPLLEKAEGGSLLTGIGGDEVFGSSRWERSMAVVSGARRPRRRELRGVALLATPRPLRRAVLAHRGPDPFPWLQPAAARALTRAWAADEAGQPARVASRLRDLQSRRAFRLGQTSLERLADDAGASIAHPLLDPRFLAAMGAVRHRGWIDRPSAMRALFGDVLPPELLSRSSKARFEGAFWGARSRAFAATWRREAADPLVVDAQALKHEWSKPEPDAHTYLLIQAAWLERQAVDALDHWPVAPRATHA